MNDICHPFVSLGLWSVVGGDKNVFFASTITHSVAASFHLFGVAFACSHYLVGRKEGKGIVLPNFSTLPFFILAVAGAVFSGILFYNSFDRCDRLP